MEQALLLQLKEQLLELSYLNATINMLGWDEQVYMPSRGSAIRAQSHAYLASLHHQKLLDLNTGQALDKLRERAASNGFDDETTALVREVGREYDRAQKLPASFVKALAEATSQGYSAWAVARKQNDFTSFQPYLEKIFDLKRQQADHLGYSESPYDALLDEYEPDCTAKEIDILFQQLKTFLIPLLQEIRRSKVTIDPALLSGIFTVDHQLAFNRRLAASLGFDYDAGRLDESPHPFTAPIHSDDVRITTRYDEQNIQYSLFSTIHEVGHALYEQGLPSDRFGTPLGQTGSLGLHESQSILWEKPVGRGLPFWQYLYPELQQAFPESLQGLPLSTFYQIINKVEPSLIRTEADEVTYVLHIILRFELERAVIEGSLTVKELPAAWSQKMSEYLGIDVPSDQLGVLQDVHWSTGAIGYFPTYALGNLYALQLYKAAERSIPGLTEMLSRGEFQPLLQWLREAVHVHGRRFSTKEILLQATGKAPSSQDFIEYITEKYTTIYQLDSKTSDV